MGKTDAASRLNKSRGFTSLIKKQQNSQQRPNSNSPFNLTCLARKPVVLRGSYPQPT